MSEPGRYQGTIEENDIRSTGKTDYVFLRVNVEGQGVHPVQIWLTPKAMGMARAQLRQCGFEPDKDSLASLAEDNVLLRGRPVPIELYEDDYGGRIQLKAKIVTNTVSKKKIGSLEAMLRDAGSTEPVSVVAPSEAEDDIPF